MAILGWLLLVLSFYCSSDALENEQCRAHPTLVPIDHPNYEYYPYFVKLHRCGGSCGFARPTITNCVVLVTKNVTISLIDISKKSFKPVQLVNHTKCGCQCVVQPSDCTAVQVWNQDSCECRCRYRDTPPTPCPRGHRWSNSDCACVCDRAPEVCPVGKTWDSRACGCVCDRQMISKCQLYGMTVDEDCKCRSIEIGAHKGEQPKENPKFSKLMLLLMVGEFVLMCLVFDAILYQKNAGLTYSITKKLGCKDGSKDIRTAETNIGKDNGDISSVTAKDEYKEQV